MRGRIKSKSILVPRTIGECCYSRHHHRHHHHPLETVRWRAREWSGEERQERQLWDLCDIHHFSAACAAHTPDHESRTAAHFAHTDADVFFCQNKNAEPTSSNKSKSSRCHRNGRDKFRGSAAPRRFKRISLCSARSDSKK